MTTFVFLHDAFQGGWVWTKLAKFLRKENYEVHCPTLSGCGDRSHLLREQIGLPTYIQDMINFLHFENLNDVVIVCHGYAGMVASAAIQAMPHLIKKAIYIDAVIPRQGKSFVELSGEWLGYLLDSHRYNSWLVKPWPSISHGISSLADKQWFESRLVNFPRTAFTSPFPTEFDSTLFNIAFIHCGNDDRPLMGSALNEAKEKGWEYHELESGPLPMIVAPEALARLLITIGENNVFDAPMAD